MKNIISLRFTRLLSLRNAFLFSLLVAFSSTFIAAFEGCSSGPTSPGSTTTATEITTIYGRITDESGASLMGVSVTAGSKSGTTDANGIFILKDATVTKGRALVLAKKTGYFNAAKAEVPLTGGTRIEMSMMTDGSTGNVSATTGGAVNIVGGASITFSGGSFTDASGAAYTGTVKVSARYLDPKSPSFFDYFSGDDMALASSGKNVSLISSGVLRVELKDQSGNTLKLDASKPATLSFPKPLDTKAPATMPLWYFDESLGMWKAEGSATLKNGMYSGTVSHFTEWNLDYYDSTGSFGVYGDVTLRVVCNGAPVGGVVITIVGDDNPGGKYFVHPGGKTGPDGTIHFIRFPANRPTLVDIRSDKNNGLYFINAPVAVNITPGQKLDLGDITLNSPCPATIKGTLVGCDDSKAEGLVTISDGKNISYIYTKTGDFTEQAPGLVPLTVDAMDANGNQATTVSVPALSSGELRDIGNLKICGSATVTYLDVPFGSGNNTYGQIIALSPDGSRLAAWTQQPTGFTIFDTKTGNILSTTTTTGASYLTAMEFSADNNKLLLSTTYGATQLYDVSGATPSMIISIPNVMSAKLYDDGSKIIGAVAQGSPNPPLLNIFSATDGSVIKTIHAANLGSSSDSIGTFGFIHSEESIVYPDGKTQGTTRVWGIQTDAELRNFPMAGNNYTFFTSEDGLTASGTSDYTTYFSYDTKTGQKYSDVALSKSGRESSPVLTQNNFYTSDQVSGAEVIRIIKLSDGTSTVKLFLGATYISTVAASRNEQYLAAETLGKIRIWKLQ
ncbi:MAG: hypothetical protein ACHQM6_02750 [Candidatus Kapaibacterium sp.]